MYIFGKWQEFDNLSDKIDEISLMGDDLRSDFINTSIFDIIEILDLMANEWTQDSEFYKKALYLLSKELTFSEDMIIASLDIIPELLSRKSLEEQYGKDPTDLGYAISSLMLDKVFKYKKVIPVGAKQYTKVSLYEKMLPSVVVVAVLLDNQ